MPRNQRPSGLFGEFDYGWEGTTLNERIQAQNQWDLLAEQEKANQIEQEKLEFMKEQAYKKERAEVEKKQLADFLDIITNSCNKIGLDGELLIQFITLFSVDPDNSEEETLKEAIKINKAYIDLQTLPKEIQNLKKEKFHKYTLNIKKRFAEKEQYNELNNQIQTKTKKYKNLVKEYISYDEDETISDWQERIEKFTKELEKLRAKKENSKLLLKDFNKFRETHYNQDIELLFKRLDLYINLDKVECKQEGTIEDYKQYFKTKILEN